MKSGKDEFFFPKDCTATCLNSLSDPVSFQHEYGVPRDKVASGKIKLVFADKRDRKSTRSKPNTLSRRFIA